MAFQALQTRSGNCRESFWTDWEQAVEIWLLSMGVWNIGEEHVCIATKAAAETAVELSSEVRRAV